MNSVSETFAQFVAETTWESLPAEVRREAKRSLLNFIGCALAVADEDAVAGAVRVLKEYSGPATAGLIGRPERLDVMSASFINALAGNFLDFDDTHLDSVIHPTAPVAPVALALAERDGASGADLLLALALGIEVECRIGAGVSPGHYDRGWHITASAGIFGAAVAAAKLMGLPAPVIADALTVATSQSSGLVENLPTAAKNVGVGNAARNGIFAALMAQAGYAGAPNAIEGKLGWARAMGDAPDLARMADGLGVHWEAARNTYKPYPAGIVFHAVIDACLALRAKHAIVAADIEQVTVAGDFLLLARGDRTVGNERDARVSIHHCAAVVFLFGKADMAEFSAETANDPAVAAFRSRVKAELADLPRAAARVEVRLKDGRVFSETVLAAVGSEQRPLNDTEIGDKVRALAVGTSAETSVDGLIDLVWKLDEVADVRSQIGLLLGRGG